MSSCNIWQCHRNKCLLWQTNMEPAFLQVVHTRIIWHITVLICQLMCLAGLRVEWLTGPQASSTGYWAFWWPGQPPKEAGAWSSWRLQPCVQEASRSEQENYLILFFISFSQWCFLDFFSFKSYLCVCFPFIIHVFSWLFCILLSPLSWSCCGCLASWVVSHHNKIFPFCSYILVFVGMIKCYLDYPSSRSCFPGRSPHSEGWDWILGRHCQQPHESGGKGGGPCLLQCTGTHVQGVQVYTSSHRHK